MLRTLSQLRDPRNLLLAVGLGQLLEHYCTVSVNAQHSSFFPTQCWDLVNIVKEKLMKLGQCWEWSSEALEYVDIEAPAKIVRRLQDDGTYTPMVRVEVATRNKQRLLDSGVIESRMEKVAVNHQFETDDGYIVTPLSGSVSMEVITNGGEQRSI